VVAVIDGNHFVLEPLYVVGHEVAAMEYWGRRRLGCRDRWR